jgi:hypothetical protein
VVLRCTGEESAAQLDAAYPNCRLGGGALSRWPPSASQTVHAGFPHTAFTKMQTSEMSEKELAQPGEQAHAHGKTPEVATPR